MTAQVFDIAVIGGGIVGLATGFSLLRSGVASLVVLEKEKRVAMHQTGHNSGVIHSGLYYRPGSLKARNCTAGREELYAFCQQEGIAYERCGKVVVATHPHELPRLDELERRGRANGLEGLKRLDADALREIEPHARGVGALHVPETGIVDFVRVAEVLAEKISGRQAEVRTSWEVRAVQEEQGGFVLKSPKGEVRCRNLVNCAGLFSDRVARLCGLDPGLAIIPFRGEYFRLGQEAATKVRHLIYPVPDPAMPFLGVHLTRMVDGRVEAGPNAVLALKREGYVRSAFSLQDTWEILRFPGFWRLASRFWRSGAREYMRSFSRRLFLDDLRQLLPDLELADLAEWDAGVRAQAVENSGALVDDFRLLASDRMIHVLNAPSPAATASLAIGDAIAEKAKDHFAMD